MTMSPTVKEKSEIITFPAAEAVSNLLVFNVICESFSVNRSGGLFWVQKLLHYIK